jgi:hypothetical protein
MAEADKAAASSGIDRLGDDVDITEQELSFRKQFPEFGDEHIKRLAAINDIDRRHADAAVELGLTLERTIAALDIEEGLDLLRGPRIESHER